MGYLLCGVDAGDGGQRPLRSRCSLIAVRASSVALRAFRLAKRSSIDRNSLGSLKGNCGFKWASVRVFFFAMPSSNPDWMALSRHNLLWRKLLRFFG